MYYVASHVLNDWFVAMLWQTANLRSRYTMSRQLRENLLAKRRWTWLHWGRSTVAKVCTEWSIINFLL